MADWACSLHEVDAVTVALVLGLAAVCLAAVVGLIWRDTLLSLKRQAWADDQGVLLKRISDLEGALKFTASGLSTLETTMKELDRRVSAGEVRRVERR